MAQYFPNDYEQFVLELINEARLDPEAAAAAFGIDLNEGLTAGTITTDSKTPLAMNGYLVHAARDHSTWMLDTGVFDHTGVNNSSPGDRMGNAGYVFTPPYGWGENIAYLAATEPLTLSEDIFYQHHMGLFLSPGHRENMMDESFVEIGIGHAYGLQYSLYTSELTENFASTADTVKTLTGVVYTDNNSNAFYSLGEGRGNTVISLGAVETTSYAAGGYSLALDSGVTGMQRVEISSGGLPGSIKVKVEFGSASIKLDIVENYWMTTGLTVRSSANTELEEGASNLELMGAATHGTGNSQDNILFGTKKDNVLKGAEGNDRLFGGEGRDQLRGGMGDDTLIGNQGADTVYGGVGDDSLRGSLGDDWLDGGEGMDLLFGGMADDTIHGGADDDYLSAGQGNDDLFGDSGNDTLYGRKGADLLRGDVGDDTLIGNQDDDTLYGGAGNDSLRGSIGKDSVMGGAGDDFLSGGVHRDTLYGDDGNDILSAGRGRDKLFGGAGNDTLNGHKGNDILTGDSGNDIFCFSNAFGENNIDTITDFTAGEDHIHLDKNIFTGLTDGALSADLFVANEFGEALDENDHILYNTTTGSLFFDADGNGSEAAVEFAQLENKSDLEAADFIVVG